MSLRLLDRQGRQAGRHLARQREQAAHVRGAHAAYARVQPGMRGVQVLRQAGQARVRQGFH